MKVRGFHHLAIQVNDLERAAAFYREILGLRELKRHTRADGSLRAIWLDVPGGGFIALEQLGSDDSPRKNMRLGYSLFALTIASEERQSIVEELARRGVDVIRETAWTVYVRDPEGNEIGLSHYGEI